MCFQTKKIKKEYLRLDGICGIDEPKAHPPSKEFWEGSAFLFGTLTLNILLHHVVATLTDRADEAWATNERCWYLLCHRLNSEAVRRWTDK